MNLKTKEIVGIITLVFSIVFFGFGLYFPLLSTYKQVIFKFGYEEITVFRTVAMFFENKEYFLAVVILVFTIIMPIVNYGKLIGTTVSNQQGNRTWQGLDKWNMLDVFLVALLLLNFKMNSNIIVMKLQIGTTFIALAVIFRILAVSFILKNKSIKV